MRVLNVKNAYEFNQARKLIKFNWDKNLVKKVISDSKKGPMSIISISNDSLILSNVPRKDVRNNFWTSCTEFWQSKGKAPFCQIALEKTEKGVEKSIYNQYLESVKPWDGIKNSEYKAVRATVPRKVRLVG